MNDDGRRDKRDRLTDLFVSQATWQGKCLGAHKYLECSARTGEGMDGVLEETAREAARRACSRGSEQKQQAEVDEWPARKRRRTWGRATL